MLVHPTHMQRIAQEHADAMYAQDCACRHYRDLQTLQSPAERPVASVRRLLRRRDVTRAERGTF